MGTRVRTVKRLTLSERIEKNGKKNDKVTKIERGGDLQKQKRKNVKQKKRFFEASFRIEKRSKLS